MIFAPMPVRLSAMLYDFLRDAHVAATKGEPLPPIATLPSDHFPDEHP